MRTKLLVLLFLASLTSYAQYTLIPDVNFENKLIELGIDNDGRNGKVMTTSISSVTTLDVSWSEISDLTGIQNFISLTSLDCKLNNLTTLDLTYNNKLVILDCRGNKLTSLDLSKLPLLTSVMCSENFLTSLDVSKNPILAGVFCSKNNLLSLNVKNGNNTKFQTLFCDFRYNPLLSCIQVDNPIYSNSNWTDFKDNTTEYSNSCGPAYTTIPDPNFENKLISLGIDTDGKNGKVLTSRIISLSTLDVSNSSITDITGLQNFLSLTSLTVSNNKLQLLNLTSQKKIKSLDCSNNMLKVLDLYENNLLVALDFSSNLLSEIDLWRQLSLVTLKGASNKLTTLNISGLDELKTVEVNSNQLADLYVSQNKSLSLLKCNNNLLIALDVSKNSALTSLFCANNQIIKLNITSNLLLREISCENNALISLNLKNGKNNLFTTYDFRSNSSLKCIEVDDEPYSVTNWSAKKDPTTNYNVYCGPFTLISDTNFENKLIALGIDIDGKNGKILTSSISNLTSLNLSNSSISDLNGIQDFINLTSLDASGNQLKKLEINNNKILRILNCSNNQIEVLNVVTNTQLTDLYCNNNNLNYLNIQNGNNSKIVNFDFRNNPNLSCILVDNQSYSNQYWSYKKDATANFLMFCGSYTLIPDANFENKLIALGIDYDGKNGKVLTSSIEELTTLNLSSDSYSNLIVDLSGIQDFKKLVNLECAKNHISNLDLSKNTALETLNCSENSKINLNLSQNLKLATLVASGCQLSNIDISKNLLLTHLDISTNQLTDLSVNGNTYLTDLNCGSNQLNSLDVSQNTALKSLDCHQNLLTILDLSNNLSLRKLKCNSNGITSLNFDNNIALTDIDCSYNTLSSISVKKNINLENFYCESTNVETIDLKNGNNTKIVNLSLFSNLNLYCIQVDSKEYSDSKWDNFKDSWISFFENCSQTIDIPDVNFENKLISLGIDRDGQNGKVYAVLIYDIKALNLSGSNITSLSGIEYFEDLTDLKCDINNLTSLDLSNNKLLESLSCNRNKIGSLDISNNKLLVDLYCASNNLNTLNVANGNNINFTTHFGRFPDFSNNPSLTCINVDNVDFSSVNWSGSKDPLTNYSKSCGLTIDIQDVNLEQKLVDLGIDKDGVNGIMLKSEAINVTNLDLSSSNITNIDPLVYFLNLQTLNCSGNQIQELRLQPNSKLTTLNCSNNNLIRLDLTKNLLLISLDCSNNKLTSATIKNGTNINIISVHFSNNIDLSCIEVDDATVFNTKWSINKDNTSTFSDSCGIYTLIPDENFEYRLMALGIDTDGKNGKVLTQNISNITELDLSNGQIKDATGIQDFVSLTTLLLNKNLLTSLDVLKNTALENLDCTDNKLSIIDLSSNVKLIKLHFDNNLLTSLDLTNNVALIDLSCLSNQLSSLKISKCVALKYLTCSKNKLTELTLPLANRIETLYCEENFITNLAVSDLKKLTALNCSRNKLTSLIFPNDTVLIDLNCSYNNLSLLSFLESDIDLDMKFLDCSNNQLLNLNVSTFFHLQKVVCSYNKLKILDLSSKDELSDVYADHNQLVSLDFSNLSYWGVPHKRGDITNNPDLKCINVTYTWVSKYYPLIKDEQSYYSDNCPKNVTILDSTFEDKLIALGIDKDGKNEKVLIESIASLTTLDVSNSAITSLKGIEDFAALEQLNCKGNQLKYLDISNNKFLKALDCSNNQLTRLNLKNGNNTAMDAVGLINNYTNNTALNCILVENQVYSSANWGSKKDSKAYYAEDCTTYTLIPNSNFEDELIAQGIDTDGKNGKVDTSSIDTLEFLDVSFKNITDLTGIQDFTALKKLYCYDNQLTALNISKNTALTSLICYSNQLTTLDVSKNTALIELSCKLNQLTSLNVSNNPALTFLTCRENKLITLDVSKSTALTSFYCYSNQLTSLNISKNIALTSLQCHSNQLTTLDISTNVLLTELYCNNNKLLNLNLKNGKNNLLNNANIDFRSNLNLSCILVDNATYSNNNWATKKDVTTSYSVSCGNPIILPSNNFTVESKGETCTNSNNGEISITAKEIYNYVALVNGQPYKFTNNSLKVDNLASGTYTVSITIPNDGFEQSYTIIIVKGSTVTGKLSIIDNKVAVEITEGTAPYTILIDGIEQFETTKSSFSVEQKKGKLLQVKTAKACEGIYATTIAGIEGKILAYPNPTSGSFEIELPTPRKEVVISLYTLDGHLISSKTYTVENGKVQLTIDNQPTGAYIAKIELDIPSYLKIIKI